MVRHMDLNGLLAPLRPVAKDCCRLKGGIPERPVALAAECFAWLFPRIWRRRCLFRSLLILDWVRQFGLDPTLNVGMRFVALDARGHCWLSLDDHVFCGTEGWPGRHDVLLYFDKDKNVRYWGDFVLHSQRGASFSVLLQTDDKR
jgi:Transglutaminase-like superfamily